MPDLVHGRLALGVADHRLRAARHRARQDVAAVGGVVGRRVFVLRARVVVRHFGGQRAVAEQGGVAPAGGEVRLEVDVQRGVRTGA